MSKINVKIIVESRELEAYFINNETSTELIKKFPLNLSMLNLYSREMCYRFDEPLPANEASTTTYEVGDIAYWTPRHSFVIFYEQTNEVISNFQKIGHINSNIDFFKNIGDTDISFELLE